MAEPLPRRPTTVLREYQRRADAVAVMRTAARAGKPRRETTSREPRRGCEPESVIAGVAADGRPLEVRTWLTIIDVDPSASVTRTAKECSPSRSVEVSNDVCADAAARVVAETDTLSTRKEIDVMFAAAVDAVAVQFSTPDSVEPSWMDDVTAKRAAPPYFRQAPVTVKPITG